MERKLQERMVGAGILVLALVIVGPLLLDGEPRQSVDDELPPGQRVDEVRTHTFQLDQPSSGVPPRPAVAPAAASAPPPRARRAEAAAVVEGAAPAAAEPAPTADTPSAEKPQAVVAARPDAEPPEEGPPSKVQTPPKTTPPAKPEPAPPTRGADGWVVQVGTFGQKTNADRLAATLKRSGFDAYVSASARGDKSLYRVRVGPAGARDEATDLAGRLAAAGHEGQVVAP